MASRGTPATVFLARNRVPFVAHEVDEVAGERSLGESVAAALGWPPERVFKTLVAEVDGQPVVAIVPVHRQLSLKALAAAAGGKRARMADPADAERRTGYVTGGISPFGQKQRLPVFLDASAWEHAAVLVSGGRRRLQVEVAPEDLARVVLARCVPGLGT